MSALDIELETDRLLLRDPVEADDATQATFVAAFKAFFERKKS